MEHACCSSGTASRLKACRQRVARRSKCSVRQEASRLSMYLELAAGTVLMAMMPPDTAQSTAGPEVVALWQFHTDETGVIRGSPRRLTSGTERASDLSASRSGARVAFLSVSYQEDVYVASCDLRRGVMGAPQRLTLDDRDDVPFDWMPDSTTILLASTRNGAAHIFKQRLDSDVAEPFVTSPGSQEIVRVTSDGRWVLYMERTPHGMRIMRVPLTGGTPELVVDRGYGDLHVRRSRPLRIRAIQGRSGQYLVAGSSFAAVALNSVASRRPQRHMCLA